MLRPIWSPVSQRPRSAAPPWALLENRSNCQGSEKRHAWPGEAKYPDFMQSHAALQAFSAATVSPGWTSRPRPLLDAAFLQTRCE